MSFTIPPTPTYRREIENVERVYKQALKKVVAQLQAVNPEDLVRREVYESQIRQLTFIINELDREAETWITEILTQSFTDSQVAALVTIGTAKDLVEAKGKHGFSLMSRQRIEAMIDQTFDEVLQAHSQMGKQLKQLVRDVQAEVLRENVARQEGSVSTAKDLRSALIREGFSKSLIEDKWKGIVDAGGRRWDLTVYSQMVAKTKIQQTQIEGARLMALENDTDLAMISSHGAKDACRHFEGQIISLEGRTRGYMTLSELRNSGLIFHPNCRHSVHPIGDVDALPSSLKERADKRQREAENAVSNKEEIKREDNKRRYQDEKARKERIKEQRRKALEKAREERARQRSSER
jgi:Phage minor capsid protein 2